MKLLTINLGLLDYNVCGITVFSNPPFSDQRIQVIPGALVKADADIIAIQEVYSEHHFNYICSAVQHVYPYAARIDGVYNCLKVHNGLMVLSKFEISHSELVLHSEAACVERWFGNKATLRADVWVPNVGRVAVINAHPTAGGYEPDSEGALDSRDVALKQTLEMAESARKEGAIPVLIGDFNCAPDASRRNYLAIINGGYRDCFEEAVAAKILTDNSINFTWDPFNILNVTGPHSHCPPARLDHVFLPSNELKLGAVKACGVVFQEKCVKIPVPNKVTDERFSWCSLSDHYGMLVDVQTL